MNRTATRSTDCAYRMYRRGCRCSRWAQQFTLRQFKTLQRQPCLWPLSLLHLPLVPAAQHSHLGRMEPSLVNRALMERGKLWGWHIPPLCTRDRSRGASKGKTLPSSPARHQRLPGWPCTCTYCHGLGGRGRDAAEEHCCREAQTGGKNEEEEPCLLPCPCCNLNHTSEHSVPRTAYSVMLHDVEICS